MRIAALTGLLMLLAACGTEADHRQYLPGPMLTGQPAIPSERFAALQLAGAPILQVGIEQVGTASVALLEASRDGVESYLSPDDVAIILGAGMLRGTRGLPADMLASDITASLRHVLSRQPGTVERFHTFLDGENRAVTQSYHCTIEVVGDRDIVIGDDNLATVLVTEDCGNADQSFTNVYWVDVDAGRIVQSRQWSGAFNGMIAMRDVTR